MSLTVTVDESARKRTYLLIAAAYLGATDRAVNQLVARHLLPGQRRFHTHHEPPARRRAFLRDVVAFAGVRVRIYQAPFPALSARTACIDELVSDAVKGDARRIVFEQADTAQDLRDRRDIHAAMRRCGVDIAHSHEPASAYPGLQIADLAGWAYGAGGEWRGTLGPIVDIERRLKP